MEKSIYCPMIHGGLTINLNKNTDKIFVNQCCLVNTFNSVDIDNIWTSKTFIPLREKNKKNIWGQECSNCQRTESSGISSLRTGMLDKFGVRGYDLSGPIRLDIQFDIGCNLACRTCGPYSSTFWQKHLKDNRIEFIESFSHSRADDMIEILKKIDLTNLGLVVFCGGETLLGNGYWKVAEAIAEMVPDCKNNVTLSFQTNGTQLIDEKYYKLIEKFHLIKLNISLDGVGEKFEYLRWPASWADVIKIMNLHKNNLPSNVMFLIEETISIFNLYYQKELTDWVKHNFSINRLGDEINHAKHLATGTFSLDSLSQEYVDSIINTNLINFVNPQWHENPEKIRKMVAEIKRFDSIRNQDWTKTFPEVAKFYSRYI